MIQSLTSSCKIKSEGEGRSTDGGTVCLHVMLFFHELVRRLILNWQSQGTDPLCWFSNFLLEIFLMIWFTSRELALLIDCKLSPLHTNLPASLPSTCAQSKGAQNPCHKPLPSYRHFEVKEKHILAVCSTQCKSSSSTKSSFFSIGNLSLRLTLKSRNACNLMVVHLHNFTMEGFTALRVGC